MNNFPSDIFKPVRKQRVSILILSAFFLGLLILISLFNTTQAQPRNEPVKSNIVACTASQYLTLTVNGLECRPLPELTARTHTHPGYSNESHAHQQYITKIAGGNCAPGQYVSGISSSGVPACTTLPAVGTTGGTTGGTTDRYSHPLDCYGTGKALQYKSGWRCVTITQPKPAAVKPPAPKSLDYLKYAYGVYFTRGVSYYHLGNYEKAIKDYKKVIELEPKFSVVYYNRALSYYKIGKYVESIKEFTKAIELEPTFAAARYARGNTYRKLGKYEEAIKDYTETIKLNPNHGWAYRGRGISYQALGKREEAAEDFRRDRLLGHQNLYTPDVRASWYPKISFVSRGKLDPPDSNDSAAAYYNRGLNYRRLGEYVEAIKEFTKAIELEPKSAAAYYHRGASYVRLGRYEKPIKDFTKVIELEPKFDDAYYWRGLAYYFLDKYGEAVEDFSEVIDRIRWEEIYRLKGD